MRSETIEPHRVRVMAQITPQETQGGSNGGNTQSAALLRQRRCGNCVELFGRTIRGFVLVLSAASNTRSQNPA